MLDCEHCDERQSLEEAHELRAFCDHRFDRGDAGRVWRHVELVVDLDHDVDFGSDYDFGSVHYDQHHQYAYDNPHAGFFDHSRRQLRATIPH
jgi:hypothetical protein